jgi:hypothetical protein
VERKDKLESGLVRSDVGKVTPIRDVEDLYIFRFEVGPAILSQLLEKLACIPVKPLRESLDAPYPGFYQLFLEGQPKYIGKTARPISERLREHVKKLRGRVRLERVSCKFAFVEDPSLVDVAEGALIRFFSSHGLAEWNLSGFGSKDTGYGRSRQATSEFSAIFPPDLDFPVTAGGNEPLLLGTIQMQIKRQAPLPFSIPRGHQPRFRREHPVPILFSLETLPFSGWVARFEAHLAPGWRVARQAEGWYVEPVS